LTFGCGGGSGDSSLSEDESSLFDESSLPVSDQLGTPKLNIETAERAMLSAGGGRGKALSLIARMGAVGTPLAGSSCAWRKAGMAWRSSSFTADDRPNSFSSSYLCSSTENARQRKTRSDRRQPSASRRQLCHQCQYKAFSVDPKRIIAKNGR
jgi:hypothetical protein